METSVVESGRESGIQVAQRAFSRGNRFSFAARLKALKAVLLYKMTGKRIPLSVTFLTTHHCNFDCQACDLRALTGNDIPQERFERLIDDVAAAGAIRVSFTGGGEPLIRSDIGALIHRAKERGLIVSLVTNGYLIDRRLADIKELDLLLVSYDSTKRLKNDEQSPLEKVLANAVLAQQHGIPVCLQPLLTKDTCQNIEKFFALSRRHGFVLSLQPLENWYQGTVPPEIIPSHQEMAEAIDKIVAEKKRHNNILNSLRYFKILKKQWPKPAGKGKCFAGVYYASVSADGFLYACNPVIKRDPEISVLNRSFKQAYTELKPPACGGCLWNCHHELNSIFAMDFATIWNLLKFSKNRLVYRR